MGKNRESKMNLNAGVNDVLGQVESSYGETKDAMAGYITYDSGSQHQLDSMVRLTVSHSNLKAQFVELRFDKHMQIEDVYVKCCHHCGGGSAESVMITLQDPIGNVMAQLTDMTKPLGFYGPEDGWGMHVNDSDPNSLSAGGWLENTNLVKKYEISDEDYEKRAGTVRKWMQAQKAKDPTWTIEMEMKRRKDPNWMPPVPKPENFEHDEAGLLEVNARCEVAPGGRRGICLFVGKVEGLQPGWWAGVFLDDPLGQSTSKDGCIKGVRYFECPEGYGTFVRPTKVICGDYPNELEDELGEI